MSRPGTIAFLIHWHFGSFLVGLAIAGVSVVGILHYQPPPPLQSDAVMASPFAVFGLPLMWMCLVVGIISAASVYAQAREMALVAARMSVEMEEADAAMEELKRTNPHFYRALINPRSKTIYPRITRSRRASSSES